MEYVCTEARFHCWNGKQGYNISFSYGIMTWFIHEDKTNNFLFKKKVNSKKIKSPTRYLALEVLHEFLNTRPNGVIVVNDDTIVG